MLTAIIGRADMLLNKIEENHPFYRMINAIQQTGEKAATLVRQLLRFTREPVSSIGKVRLNDLINDLRETINAIMGSEYTFVYDLDPTVPAVQVDSAEIQQIIMNLIINACEAMPNGGKVTLSTKYVEDRTNNYNETDSSIDYNQTTYYTDWYVQLSIKDDGPGFPREPVRAFFKPFSTTKKGVAGLGLYSVLRIVEKWKGRLLAGTSENGGAEIIVLLPPETLTEPEKITEIKQKDDIKKPIPRGNESVLIVEDVEEARDLAYFMLSDLGYKVKTAADGMEALQIYENTTNQIDLILTDVVLPGMRGTDLFKHIKNRNPTQNDCPAGGFKSHSTDYAHPCTTGSQEDILF
jgi:two-component system cell cycle sensor histidine kinase/response regulator CckA